MFRSTVIAAALLVASFNVFGETVAFESGVGGCATMSDGDTFTNQCASDGVTGTTNDYYYTDPRDTFDGQGISDTIIPGQLLFTSPASDLSIDYVLVEGTTGTFTLLDSSDDVLATFTDSAPSGNVDATHDFGSASGIAELDFSSGGTGVVGVSTVTFDTTSTPEPGTFVLLAAGLAGMVWKRRRASSCAAGT